MPAPNFGAIPILQFPKAWHIIILSDTHITHARSANMAFLGFFKKRGLENMKIPKVKKDLLQAERLEGEHGRQISSYQEKIESKRLYAQSERGRISDLDRKQLAKDIAELEFDISASSQQQSKARKRKRALKGLLIVLEEREHLKQSDAWGTLAGMDPQDLEDSLARLGDMDAGIP